MTQEEKLNEAKRLYKTANADQRYVLESLFLELRESEDERIRKDVKRAISVALDYSYFDIETANNCLAWLEKQDKKEYALKSFKDEDVHEFMQYIEKEAKAYEFNLPNRSYDIYAFAKDILVWLEKQGEKPAWSEEDELSLKQAIYVCHQNGYTAVENWLKSLKQRIGG